MELASGAFLISFIEIILIDLVLSGDNAVVIAMATRNLDSRNRKKAFVIGAAGAIMLRMFFTGLTALTLIRIPFLQLIGGLVLLWIAVKLLTEKNGELNITPQKHLSRAVKTIILADVIMSLDNVLAVGAASHGNLPLLLTGLVLSMTLLMAGSRILSGVMARFNFITEIGAGIIAWVAGDMISSDGMIKMILPAHAALFISAAAVLAVFVAAQVMQSK